MKLFWTLSTHAKIKVRNGDGRLTFSAHWEIALIPELRTYLTRKKLFSKHGLLARVERGKVAMLECLVRVTCNQGLAILGGVASIRSVGGSATAAGTSFAPAPVITAHRHKNGIVHQFSILFCTVHTFRQRHFLETLMANNGAGTCQS